MRINIIEKFGLYEKLSDLSKGLMEHEESKNICDKAIHELKKEFSIPKLNLYLEQLKQYEWVTVVENFLNDVDTFVNENTYGLQLENIMGKLNGINTYVPIVESIKEMVALDESEIKSNIGSLSKFKYEPNIKRLIEGFEKAEFNSQTTSVAEISHSPITPVMQLEEGFVISAKSGEFVVSNDLENIEVYEGKLSSEFIMGKNALHMFKYKGNNTFEAVLRNANIKITASDKGNAMFVNESEIKTKSQLSTLLKKTGLISHNDLKTRAIVEFMYEKADSFVEIDFVKSVETVNENFEVFKMANNDVHISKYDSKVRKFVLESLDIEDIEDLSESIKKNYNLDFDNILEGLNINVESLEFKRLVESIDISTVVDTTKVDDVYNQVNEANKYYNSIPVSKRSTVENEFGVLLEKESKLNSEKVRFLLETKKGVFHKVPEGKELDKTITMLNEELSILVTENVKMSKNNKPIAVITPNKMVKIYNSDGSRDLNHPIGFYQGKDIEFYKQNYDVRFSKVSE